MERDVEAFLERGRELLEIRELLGRAGSGFADAHRADALSLPFLAYPSRRLEERPILLFVAVRPAEIRADIPALSDVLANPLARVLNPTPLSLAAVRALVHRSLTGHADEEFCLACQAARAGSPLFLPELIASLSADGIAPTPAASERVAELASRAVSSGVLAGLPSPAIELARAAGILGAGAELRHAAALDRSDGGTVAQASRAPAKRSRARARSACPPLAALGLVAFAASTAIHCARIDLLAGDLSTAEEELRRAYDALASIDEKYLLPPIGELLAQVVYAQGRFHEAAQIRQAAEELAARDDVELQALWPSLRGTVLPWQERADEAERRAREAVDLIRIRVALSRLTTWVSQNAKGDNDRSASDRRAWNADRRLAPAGLTRERFLRDILANETLPDGYARALALETLDIPEELFAKTITSSETAELAQPVAEALTTNEVAASRLAELLQSSRSKS